MARAAPSEGLPFAYDEGVNNAIHSPKSVRNRLAGVKPYGAKKGGKKERAIFNPQEIEKLVAVANAGDKSYGLEGVERAFLYLLAYQTGLRYSEAKSLAPESFDLVAVPPTVTVKAMDTKNRKKAVLPLSPDLVPVIEQHLQKAKPGLPVFGGGKRKGKGAPMIHADMKSADIPLCDDKDNVRDFHSLRHTYCTLLARSGVPLIMAQKLMRHSDPKLTANFYTHLEVENLAKEVVKLPAIVISKGKASKPRQRKRPQLWSPKPCETTVPLNTINVRRILYRG